MSLAGSASARAAGTAASATMPTTGARRRRSTSSGYCERLPTSLIGGLDGPVCAVGRVRFHLLELRCVERVAARGLSDAVPDAEPVLALRRRSVRPRLRVDLALRLGLDPVVA